MSDLTAARIRRANPTIDKETARADAAIVHDIIAHVRKAYSIQSTDWCGGEDDTCETVLRTVAGVKPLDHDDACREGEWMMHQLTRAEQLTGVPDLYRRWLRVCGHVENYDYENLFDDDPPPSDDDDDAQFRALMAVKLSSGRQFRALRVVEPTSGDDDAVFKELMAREIDV